MNKDTGTNDERLMAGAIDTADHVKHGPTGEEWLVARITGAHVCPCGWPPTRAALGDCTLTYKATDAERTKLLHELAAGQSEHAAWARDALGGEVSQ